MDVIESYIAQAAFSGARPGSVDTWRCALRCWQRFLAPTRIEDATHQDVIAWLGRPLAATSRRSYRSTLVRFYGWASEEGYIPADPTVKIPKVRCQVGLPRPMSDGDLSLALTRADPRMRAWLLLGALAGLRCIEIAALAPGDLVQVEGVWMLYLRVTKGGKPATVPAHEAILQALAVLPVRDGTWWQCSRGYVSQKINAHLHACGIQSTAHSLRHSAGTAWHRASGYDLLLTARLMRHQNVGSSQVYAQLEASRPAEVVAKVVLSA